MNRKLRLATLLAAALAALGLAGSALAAFTPKLAVSHSGTSSTYHVTAAASQAEDPIARIAIYAPSAYTATLNQAPGTTIGTANANVFARDVGLTLPLQGNVVVANPTDPTLLATAQACQYPGTPAAIWALALSVAGQAVTIPVFVGPTTGAPDSALGAYRTIVCLPPPDVPPGTPGRSANGAQLLNTTFTVSGVYTVPSAGGLNVWESLMTPYTPNTGRPNPLGTVEARALVPVGAKLSLTTTYTSRTNTWRLRGTATAGSTGLGGATVGVFKGLTRAALRHVTDAVTQPSGAYATSGRLTPKRTSYFQTRATADERDATATGCAQPLPRTVAPAGCVSATASAWTARSGTTVIPVKVAKKKKK